MNRAFSPGRSGKSLGRSAGDWMLFGLIGLIVLLGIFAIGRGVMAQKQIASTFNGWYEDYPGYQKAMAEQAQTGKPVLVYFYAPWCPHCKHFAADILSKPEMQTYVKKYPHVRISPEKGALERQLMDDYKAEGFPTFYVAKKDGARIRVETHPAGLSRLKTADEFIQDVEKAAH